MLCATLHHTVYIQWALSPFSLILTYSASWCKNCPTEEVISSLTVSSHFTFPQTGVINLTWDVMIFLLLSSLANIKKLWVSWQLCDISVSLDSRKASKWVHRHRGRVFTFQCSRFFTYLKKKYIYIWFSRLTITLSLPPLLTTSMQLHTP